MQLVYVQIELVTFSDLPDMNNQALKPCGPRQRPLVFADLCLVSMCLH